MYIIRPEIFAIKGFNSEHYWLLSNSLAKRMKNETRECFPSLDKIAEDCQEWSDKNQKYEAWGLTKVSRVIADLVKLKIISKNQIPKFGGGVKNIYKVETDLVEVTMKIKIEGELQEEITPSQIRMVHPPILEITPSQNGSLTRASIELTTTTSIKDSENFFEKTPEPKSEIDIWEPNPVYQQAIDRVCPSLTQDDYTLELLAFRDHHRNKTPLNPDKAWTNWCKLAETTAYDRLKSKERVDRADDQANQRMQEFDTLKRENIAKIGTNPTKNNYSGKPSNQDGFVPKPIFAPRPSDFRNREEFDQACSEARDQGKIVEPYPITTTNQEQWGENVAVSFRLNSRLATETNIDQNINQTDLYEAKRRALIEQFNSIKS